MFIYFLSFSRIDLAHPLTFPMRLPQFRRSLFDSSLLKWLVTFVWPKNSFILFLGLLLHVFLSSTFLPSSPPKSSHVVTDNSSIFTVLIAKKSRAPQLKAIHATWLQRMSRFHVFSDGAIRDPNVPQTRMPRVPAEWKNWLRTRWIAHFTKEHISDDSDWHIFVHDGTFLVTEEVKLLLRAHSAQAKIYFVIGERVAIVPREIRKGGADPEPFVSELFGVYDPRPETRRLQELAGNVRLARVHAYRGFRKVEVDEDPQGRNRYLHVKRHLSPNEYSEHTRLGIYDDGKSIFDHLSRDILAFFNLRNSELQVYELLLYGIERSHLSARTTSNED